MILKWLSLVQNFGQCTWQRSTALRMTLASNPLLRAHTGTPCTPLLQHVFIGACEMLYRLSTMCQRRGFNYAQPTDDFVQVQLA